MIRGLGLSFIYRESAKELSKCEFDVLLAAQKAVFENGGVLGLFPDLRFLIGWSPSESAYAGLLAIRDDPDADPWIQIAFTHPDYRNRGVCSSLIEELARRYPKNVIGMATNPTNAAMLKVAENYRFKQRVVYLYRVP